MPAPLTFTRIGEQENAVVMGAPGYGCLFSSTGDWYLSHASNHLTGCAVDIRCIGMEQALRYASILLDISDMSREDFDELLIEQKQSVIWIHFAVRPQDNRRKTNFKR